MFEPRDGTKAELRKRFKALRAECGAEQRLAWSQAVCEHLAAFCLETGIHRVAAFAPFGTEVDLTFLEFSNPQLTFYFPRVAGVNPPRLVWGPRPLEPGTWGLQEPACAPNALPPVQLILVPGLAFAADGQRLGYGRGFYDSVLAALPEDVITLAAGFELQRCQTLPAGPTDIPVRGLATEAGITWF